MPARRRARSSGRTGAGLVATIGVVVYSRQYRAAVLAALERSPGLIPADLGSGDGNSGRELEHLRPDAVLLDLPHRRMLPFVRTARHLLRELVVVAANCDDDEDDLIALFEAGVSAFVPNDAGEEEMLGVLRDALAGEMHCPPRIAAALARRVNAAGEAVGAVPAPVTRLTVREAQIVGLLGRWMTNKEIAATLGIAAETVRNHVYNICRKLQAHRRTEIAVRLREGVPVLRIVRGRNPERR